MRWSEAAGMAARLARAHVTGAAVPFHTTLYVTTHCDLRCVYCSFPYQREQELSADQWCGIIDELADLGGRRVLFLGGEPLLRKDLEPIVRRARERGLRCALGTNGTFVPRREAVVRLMDTVTLSLDGDEQAHDTNRGEGAYAATLEAIRCARAWSVPIKVNAVLNANNVDMLDWLLEFADNEEISVSLNVMRADDNGLYHDASAHEMENDRVRAMLDRIIEAKRRPGSRVLFSERSYQVLREWPDYRKTRLSYEEAGDDFVGPRCTAGRFHCAIYSNGTLYPCSLTLRQLPGVNVLEHGVAGALAVVRGHDCATCSSACLLEHNHLFSMNPRVLWSLGRTYLRTRYD